MRATRAKIEAALRAEAKKLNAKHRGVHVFDPIYPAQDAGANWSANFRAIGSTLPMDELRAALERVQARFPLVDLPK